MKRITFCGAAREVTGSCHLLETDGASLLLDCGMIQGGGERHRRNREPFPFKPALLNGVALSHAHIDHSARLPLLIKAGYRGPILATEPTMELLRIMLADAGRIQEEDARWKIRRLQKQGLDHSWVEPLFTEAEGLAVLDQVVPVAFDEPEPVPGVGTVCFRGAGHILGAAIVEVECAGGRRLVYSGDLGTARGRLLGPPATVEAPEVLLIESTYGDRSRSHTEDPTEQLLEVVTRTIDRGGRVIIPAFAVGRTQEILTRLNDLVESGRLRGVPIILDSPMAIAATHVFELHPEAYSAEARALQQGGDDPLDFPGLHFIGTVEESMALNHIRRPCVIISASGMCTAGRVKHHLRHSIRHDEDTVLFVGYQARGTLGRRLQEGAKKVRIFGMEHPVVAQVASIEGFSAHADREELVAWFGCLGGLPRRTFVIHGEERAAGALAEALREQYGARVEVPEPGQTFRLEPEPA